MNYITLEAGKGEGVIFMMDRATRILSAWDIEKNEIISSTPLASNPDFIRYSEPTKEVWVTEPDMARIEVFVFYDGTLEHSGFIPEISSPQVINYTLTSITDATDCSNNGASLSTTSLTVNPLPTGTIATSTNSVCFGTDISLVFNGNPNTGPYQLQIKKVCRNQ